MKKSNFLSLTLFTAVFSLAFSITASANSSWRWISESRPHDVLPFVILLTLVIEFLLIYFIAKAKNLLKITLFVFLANALSFAAPYLLLYIVPSLYTFQQTLEHTPFYIVGIVYWVTTIIIEVPTVYIALQKQTENLKKLFLTIITANTLTTILTAIIERTVCKGIW